MIWHFEDTGENTGRFNMDYDLTLAKNCQPGEAYFRLYRWEPYCISLGANQEWSVVNQDAAQKDGIEIVRRPTGGRAILHSEEITYSVVYPVSELKSAKMLYTEINLALIEGLQLYNETLARAVLEDEQPHFPSFYKEDLSAACFAVPARSEIKFDGKKLVGSAQRKLNKCILQHGSVLCGKHHLKIADYLNLDGESRQMLKNEMQHKTIELGSVLNEKTDYSFLSSCLKKGMEVKFGINYYDEIQSGITYSREIL